MVTRGLVCSPEELISRRLDVIIIGSGPAGVAVAERLYQQHKTATIGILERGGVLTLSHINNIFPNELRRRFIDRFKINPWDGAFHQGGMLIPALGGRGIAAGAHLRRFDFDDFQWPQGDWPQLVVNELPRYYNDAETARRVGVAALRGPAQTWALGTLHGLHAYPPTIGLDLWTEGGFEIGRGYDSSVSRLWKMLIEDSLDIHDPRLNLITNAYVTAIEHDATRVEGIRLINTLAESNQNPFFLEAKILVLAASTIESARLYLNSRFSQQRAVAGCYLAEHIERRAKIRVPTVNAEVHSQGVSIVIPPRRYEKRDVLERFQIHLRGQPDPDGNLIIDIGGFAAMDPVRDNRVTISSNVDEHGIPKAFVEIRSSDLDEERVKRMCERIREIQSLLGGEFITEQFTQEDVASRYTSEDKEIQVMDWGRSYHEAGTMRMGTDRENSVTNEFGQVHGISNLYVADASVFPCVGIANPMLTITALAYRVADQISKQI